MEVTFVWLRYLRSIGHNKKRLKFASVSPFHLFTFSLFHLPIVSRFHLFTFPRFHLSTLSPSQPFYTFPPFHPFNLSTFISADRKATNMHARGNSQSDRYHPCHNTTATCQHTTASATASTTTTTTTTMSASTITSTTTTTTTTV